MESVQANLATKWQILFNYPIKYFLSCSFISSYFNSLAMLSVVD